MTRERIGRFCIILGGLCILAAAFLLGFNLREERRAAAATQRILPAVAHSIGQSPAPMPTLPAGELTVSLEGEEYLGILSLPTLALELPVGAEWEMDFLRQAPCRYAGTLAGDDVIIAAHNYRRHFAALHTLRPTGAKRNSPRGLLSSRARGAKVVQIVNMGYLSPFPLFFLWIICSIDFWRFRG